MAEDIIGVKPLKTSLQKEKIEEAKNIPSGMVIGITNPEGVGGDSLYGLNLAVFLALNLKKAGKTVCFVDAAGADTSKIIGLFYPNISTLVNKETIDVETVRDSLVHRADLNLSLLLPDSDPESPQPDEQVYEQIINILKQEYDYVIVTSYRRAPSPAPLSVHWIEENAQHLLLPVLSTSGNIERSKHWLEDNFAEGMLLIRIDAEGWGAKNEIEQTNEEFNEALMPYPVAGNFPSPSLWERSLSSIKLAAFDNERAIEQHFRELLFMLTEEPVLLEVPEPVKKDNLLTKLRRIFTG